MAHRKLTEEHTWKIYSAKKYVDENFGESLSVEMLCEKFEIAKGYFTQGFMTMTGKRFINYLFSVRMHWATEWLVHTNIPIAIIAKRAGYPDYEKFVEVFHRKYDVDPLRYRAKKRGHSPSLYLPRLCSMFPVKGLSPQKLFVAPHPSQSYIRALYGFSS